jgi:DUF1707 SHOCT-like domain
MRRPYLDPSDLTLLDTLGLPGARARTRASDAERDRAVEALGRHHADGRLTMDELEERTERAHAATTLGDLDQLFDDLPRLPTPAGERRARRPQLWPPVFAFPLFALLLGLAVVTSAHALFLWPLLFFLVFRFMFMRRFWRGRRRGWPELHRHY